MFLQTLAVWYFDGTIKKILCSSSGGRGLIIMIMIEYSGLNGQHLTCNFLMLCGSNMLIVNTSTVYLLSQKV